MTKVLYLKTLAKNSKPDSKVIKLITEAVSKSGLVSNKSTVKPNVKPMSGKKFILDNVNDFLHYAVDYSMYDKTLDLFKEEPEV